MAASGVASLPAFRGLWLATTAVHAGSDIAVFAVSVGMITVLGASPFEAGLAAPLSSAGPLLFGLVAGVVVDRWGQRRTMLAMTWLRAAAYACAVALFFCGWLEAWQLLLVILVVGIADVFFMAAYTSVLPRLVGRHRIADASSSVMVAEQVVSLAGPAAGGILVRFLPAPAVLAVSAAMQLIAAAGLSRLPPDNPALPKPDRPGVRESIATGIRFIAGHRLLLALILTTATNNFAAGIYQAAETWFILHDLAMDPALFGAIWSVSAVGGIAGAVLAPRVGRAMGPLRAMLLAAVMMPVNFALIPLTALWPHLAVPGIGLSFTLFGLALGLMMVNSAALTTALIPDDLLARVSSTRRTLTQGAVVLGGVLGALLLGWIGAVPTLWLAVAVALGQCVFLLRMGVPRRGVPLPSELPAEPDPLPAAP
ncbi:MULTISPECIES: MFS transporter [unclassified Arthrobacter]|uniref:MFS transporter n=1 Tax=unclassified Arthrobacter TaxID=235627 RepID=UPI0024DFB180|nr:MULTISPECIES: MFS transporter [unclassified Arthrobacter]MCC9144875.1 MFS transporter [Arthrobacter sp. zg-Y919]MDK1276101.1 MFS transporter [Arthrobacter sp. zg.Y919]WIB02557.1 MFS transporter [Arthrobacter sp. zg-Y919]